MQRDFLEYTWSLPTLGRRLRYFNINKTHKNIPIEVVQRIVLEEISGPVLLSGYCAIHATLSSVKCTKGFSLHCHERC